MGWQTREGGKEREKMPSRKEMKEVPVHHFLLTQDLLHHLWGSLQHGHVGSLVQRLLRIAGWRQQSIQPSEGPFSVQGPMLQYGSHAHDTNPVPTPTCCQSERSMCYCGPELGSVSFPRATSVPACASAAGVWETSKEKERFGSSLKVPLPEPRRCHQQVKVQHSD